MKWLTSVYLQNFILLIGCLLCFVSEPLDYFRDDIRVIYLWLIGIVFIVFSFIMEEIRIWGIKNFFKRGKIKWK